MLDVISVLCYIASEWRDQLMHFFETDLAARTFMAELITKHVAFSYYHESCCRHWVKIVNKEAK